MFTKNVKIKTISNVTKFGWRKEVESMTNYHYMMSADDVAKELNCSKSHAYKLVKSLNQELAKQGYITMAGRIPRAYWAKKIVGYYSSRAKR